jgi:hypothetical protein
MSTSNGDSEKPIWSGKYSGIDAYVILRGPLVLPFLAGQLAVNRFDSDGIMEAAVRGLASERDELASVAETFTQCALADKAELATFRKDLEDAAGELMVPIPEPGSIASKMLLANRMMFRDRDALRERLAKLEAAVREVVDLRDECANERQHDLTQGIGRKLDHAICQMSVETP